jgi:hypothetical protein
VLPPTGTTFEFSPTICTGNYQGMNTTYIAAVASGKLWFSSNSGIDSATQQPWALVSSDVGSAPDCVVTNENELNIVALNKNGSIMYHKGTNKGANWLSSDLGAY